MNGNIAYVTGRGEHITPIDVVLPWTILLVLPDIHISTVHAYSTLGITQRRQPVGLDKYILQAVEDQSILRDHFINDFERSIFTEHPLLSTIKRSLLDQGAIYASMSGSGAAMYGLFTDVDIATRAQTFFRDQTTYICRPL
jgi:4-diphosphocytidyl-2-C-methyl-D-erythritol kinase